MIKQEIIDNLNNAFREIRKQYDDLSPVLEIVSALIDRAITANFDAHGRWDGDESNIGLFSGGSQKWKSLAGSTKSSYEKQGYELQPILNRTKGLMSSIEVRPQGKSSVIISANAPYAAIHNYGGTVKPSITITPRMRNFFWYKFYETGHISWKALALTKKKKLEPVIEIPARPLITLTEGDLDEIVTLLLIY